MNEIYKEFIDQFKIYDCYRDNSLLTKIRIGSDHDGGYVVYKEACEQLKNIYTFGVGDDISFEIDLINNFPQIDKINLYDPTIDNIRLPNEKFVFRKSTIDLFDLQKIFGNEKMQLDSLFKMDVEYDEWEYLSQLNLNDEFYFNQIIVEFHIFSSIVDPTLTPYFTGVNSKFINIINEKLFTKYITVLRLLNEDYYMYHVHVNNSLPSKCYEGIDIPQLIEVSFIKKELVDDSILTKSFFPTCFDFANKYYKPDVIFTELNRRIMDYAK